MAEHGHGLQPAGLWLVVAILGLVIVLPCEKARLEHAARESLNFPSQRLATRRHASSVRT
jgi:hypothetical protein